MKIKIPKPQFGKKSIIFTVMAAFLLFADLISKYLEEKFHPWKLTILPGVVELQSGHRNDGVAFGLFGGNPEVAQPLFIAFTLILTVALIAAFIMLPEKFTLLKLACAMIISGAIGNLVDRIMFSYVRDWFGLWMNPFSKDPIAYCNFADFWVVIGTVIAVIDLMFLNEMAVVPLTEKAKAAQQKQKEKNAEKSDEQTPDE